MFIFLYLRRGLRIPRAVLLGATNVYQIRLYIHSQKKGTKAVTGAVPFQKVNFCPF